MKKLNRIKLFTVALLAITVISCKNYYNETIKWADNLESELTINEVKKINPNLSRLIGKTLKLWMSKNGI